MRGELVAIAIFVILIVVFLFGFRMTGFAIFGDNCQQEIDKVIYGKNQALQGLAVLDIQSSKSFSDKEKAISYIKARNIYNSKSTINSIQNLTKGKFKIFLVRVDMIFGSSKVNVYVCKDGRIYE